MIPVYSQALSALFVYFSTGIFMTLISLKIKCSYPELNPDLRKMQRFEGNSRGIQITFVPLKIARWIILPAVLV